MKDANLSTSDAATAALGRSNAMWLALASLLHSSDTARKMLLKDKITWSLQSQERPDDRMAAATAEALEALLVEADDVGRMPTAGP